MRSRILSLAAAVLEAGEDPIDRSTFVRWRDGESCAPLGLLPLLLDHVDDPAAVLDLLARPLGLRVVPDGDIDTDERGLADRALEVGQLVGEVQQSVREALADGRVTETERADIYASVELAIRRLQELSTLTAPKRRAS